MTKKLLPLLALITLGACLLTYKLGSAPVALAKAMPNPQEASESAVPLTLPTAPATWTLTAEDTSGGTTFASATRPAGGAGVKHVATCISFSFYQTSGSGSFLYLRDGPSKTGTILFQLIPVAVGSPSVVQSVCGLNIVGSPNTPMTLEFATDFSGQEALNLVGYDAM
jgi:hypothetical protein